MLYQQRHTQSNPLNERWRQTISRWLFVYCVQWNKTAHSLTPEIIIGVDVLHRWKVKVNSIINYLDYNKSNEYTSFNHFKHPKRVNKRVTDISIMVFRFTTQIKRISKVWYRCSRFCQRIQLEERFTKIAIKNINCL